MRMSAYEMGGLFAPPPPLMGHHHMPNMGSMGGPGPIQGPIWPPINGHHNPLGPTAQSPFAPPQNVFSNLGLGLHHPALSGQHTGFPATAPMPAIDMTPKQPDTIKGHGQLTWLSSKAGLISYKNDTLTISFQIKDFCDQQLTDLTGVLRVGFTLSFQACLSETNDYIATLVSPLYGQESESVFANSGEVNLEQLSPIPPNSKDAYGCAEEAKAIPALLAIFQRHSLPQIQLSSMHSQMSSCGDDDLFRYVGSSSLKRRQFVERRTHLFKLTPDDTIALQPPWVYSCVYRLACRLLRRGGATAIQSLYEYYLSTEMPAEIRECVGDGRSEFLTLIQSHPWIFALFPNRTYVSVRRNLPHFDYTQFIKQTFPDCDSFRPPSGLSNHFGGVNGGGGGAGSGAPRGVMRSMSHQPLTSALSSGSGRQAPPPSNNRPHSLWESQTPIVPPLTSPADQSWSPLFSSTSSTWRPSPVPSTNSLLATPTHQQKVLVSTSVQTSMSGGPIGEGECTCRCNCGKGRGQRELSRTSAGSASPPSLESASSPSSGGPSSPAPPMRYYDPFGFDMKATFANLGI